MEISEVQFGNLIETVEYLLVNLGNGIEPEVLKNAIVSMHKILKEVGPSHLIGEWY